MVRSEKPLVNWNLVSKQEIPVYWRFLTSDHLTTDFFSELSHPIYVFVGAQCFLGVIKTNQLYAREKKTERFTFSCSNVWLYCSFGRWLVTFFRQRNVFSTPWNPHRNSRKSQVSETDLFLKSHGNEMYPFQCKKQLCVHEPTSFKSKLDFP